jgi:hypothetical protein
VFIERPHGTSLGQSRSLLHEYVHVFTAPKLTLSQRAPEPGQLLASVQSLSSRSASMAGQLVTVSLMPQYGTAAAADKEARLMAGARNGSVHPVVATFMQNPPSSFRALSEPK